MFSCRNFKHLTRISQSMFDYPTHLKPSRVDGMMFGRQVIQTGYENCFSFFFINRDCNTGGILFTKNQTFKLLTVKLLNLSLEIGHCEWKYPDIWQLLTHSHTMTPFDAPGKSLLKTLWEKEKLLVTSNFSFSHSVFLPVWITFYLLFKF